MKCKKAEKLLLRSFDGILKIEEKDKLERHIKICLLCQRKKKDYQSILEALKEKDFPEARPYFWERLQPKLKERKKYEPLLLWKQWGMKTIPLSLLMIILLTIVLIFSFQRKNEELSQSGILLFQNANPIQEAKIFLEEGGIENKNMMVIFSSLEEKNGVRR